jgi:hypothetical protein
VLAFPVQAGAATLPGPQTFSYVGAEQVYRIPAGVTMVQVEAVGGNGSPDLNHGVGLDLTVALPVVAGHRLYVEVGAVGGVSAFGGGGPGATDGGGGGGASDVRTCSETAASCPGGGTSAASRLVVASGGGGGGGAPPADDFGSACGVNGGGGNGWDESSAPVSVAGGTVLLGLIGGGFAPAVLAEGGQAAGPGAGGMTPDCNGFVADFGGAVSGAGGSGANGGAGAAPSASPPGGGGGGGGGGYFGGGGGASGQTETAPNQNSASGAGGGAGGSSFFSSQATGLINYFHNGTDTQPTVTISPLIELSAPIGGAHFGQGQVVDASYACLDSCTGTVASGSPIDTSTLGVHTFQVSDQLESHPAAVTTVHYTVVAPSITVNSPTKRARYTLNQVVIASYSCSEPAGSPGIASCAGPVASGSAIDTATVGAKTFTVNSTDNAGATSTKTVHYRVVAAASTQAADG